MLTIPVTIPARSTPTRSRVWASAPAAVTPEMVKPGAVVVDVGINRIVDADGNRHTVGDVDFEGVRDVAGWITPVPGGVGPITVAMLLRNAVDAALS